MRQSSTSDAFGNAAPDQRIRRGWDGRTSVKGVYAAGEVISPSQLIVAAAQGSMAAAGVNTD